MLRKVNEYELDFNKKDFYDLEGYEIYIKLQVGMHVIIACLNDELEQLFLLEKQDSNIYMFREARGWNDVEFKNGISWDIVGYQYGHSQDPHDIYTHLMELEGLEITKDKGCTTWG